uniref:Protein TRIGALACTOSYLDIACYLGLYCEROL 4, chloroplastic n=1 Tax=Fagus sylvatica TaxID=28930 RepID=A0A2N9EI98_FAGSY
MKKLRWAMDGSFWDLDVSTPMTADGLARPAPGDPIPLGVSRGTRLSRAKQIHFMQRFMTAPFVPSYAASSHGFVLHPRPHYSFLSKLFNFQKMVSSVKESGETPNSASTWLKTIGKHLRDKSLYVLGFSSELLLTPDDTLLLSFDSYTFGDNKPSRKKAILHHKFPNHNLTVEAVSPGLFVDKSGNYWDVPISMAIDMASLASDSGASYHLCMHHNTGSPTQFQGDHHQTTHGPPATLLPGLSIKSAFSFKQNFDFWRSKAPMLKMVQPYDIFLANPHISASGIIGAALTASVGDCSVRSQDDSQDSNGFFFQASGLKSAFLADLFASVSLTAQHGNYQRLFLDLTRFHARFDFPSGSRFLEGATHVVQKLLNSQQPSLEAVQAICPNATLSLQQQIAGPFLFRVDSGVTVDLKNQDWPIRVEEPVFALEYSLQVLGSAKAVAWYSPKQREFMVELRFYET